MVSKNLNNGSYYLIDVREHKDSRKSEEETRRPYYRVDVRDHKDSRMSEEETARRGILLIFDLITPEPPALIMYIL